ncbi:unnamed protein product [Sphagnum jensenii]
MNNRRCSNLTGCVAMRSYFHIPGYLEGEFLLRKKDAELISDQVSVLSPVPTIRRICINKTNRNKTLHLQVEIDMYIIEGLKDTGASMFVMAAAVEQEVTDYTKDTSCESLEADLEELSLVGSEDVSETVSDTDTEDDNTGELQPMNGLDGTSEFGNTEFEDLVLKEGPEQILQLTLQDQADEFMKEEVSDSDDYADWIRWVSDAKERKACNMESTMSVEAPAVLQAQRPTKDEDPHNPVVSSSECSIESTRWQEISQRIQIDRDLGEEGEQQLWKMLGSYQDVFAWSKRELGCCTIGEHSIDTQGFLPCNMSPSRLSF